MKKPLLFCLVVMAVFFSFTNQSCKKVTHNTDPTPGNVRLMGMTITTTPTVVMPHFAAPQPVTVDYSFTYDGNNRLSRIYFTTNDSNMVKIGEGNLISNFTYNGTTVTKTTSLVQSSRVLEQDTFMVNASGLVTNANFPFSSFSFSYYGQLMVHSTLTYRDTGTTVTGQTAYTSSSGDFLTETFNGTLNATFPDSGYKTMMVFPDTVRDTILSDPLAVTWTNYGTTITSTNRNINSYTDQLTGYSENQLTLDAIDPNGIRARTVIVPEDVFSNKTYTFYGDQNRTGDFMQLNSFIIYGYNIYQNANLLQSIMSPKYTTKVTYTIDGDSKITQLLVTVTDIYGNVGTSVYSLQYGTY